MSIRVIRRALLVSVLPAAGCGTVANLARPAPEGGKVPFGGVKQDVWRVETAAHGGLGPAGQAEAGAGGHPQVARVLLWAADLPFSLVGDLLSWPYVRAYNFINQPTLAAPALLVTPPPPATQPPPPPEALPPAGPAPAAPPEPPAKTG